MKFNKVSFIYNSNAIEGVETPIAKVEKAIQSKETDDIHIQNHLKTFKYIDKLELPMTPLKLLDIHRQLSSGILDKKHCGKFRKSDVSIGLHTPPNWKTLQPLIKDLIYVINSNKDPWVCHMEFEYIHPFIDLNGRTGRMLLYWQEKKQGIEPRVILNENKGHNYYDKLSEYGKRFRPTLWKINVWKKILTKNQTYVCIECGKHHEKIVEKCGTCGNANETKFQIYADSPPLVGPIV